MDAVGMIFMLVTFFCLAIIAVGIMALIGDKDDERQEALKETNYIELRSNYADREDMLVTYDQR